MSAADDLSLCFCGVGGEPRLKFVPGLTGRPAAPSAGDPPPAAAPELTPIHDPILEIPKLLPHARQRTRQRPSMENGRLGVDESVAVLSVKTGLQLAQLGCTGWILHAEVDLTNRTQPIVDVVAEDKSRVQGDVIPSRGNDVCPFSRFARVGKESAVATAVVGDCGPDAMAST